MAKSKDDSKRKKRITAKEVKPKRLRTLKPRWFTEPHVFDCGRVVDITFQKMTPAESTARQAVWVICDCDKCKSKVHTFVQGVIYQKKEME